MTYEVTLSRAEEIVLRDRYDREKKRLSTRWNVDCFEDYLHLLMMHGSDCYDQLPFMED